MKVLNFNEFLYEDGEGGGGVASATMGNTGGMGNITSPTVSATPGDVAGSKPGSGDIAAHAVRPATKIPATNRKKPKKRKFQLEPKIVRMAGTNASKESMYVTSFKDWTGSGVNENNEVGLWTIYHGLGGGFGGAIADDEPFEGTEEQANTQAWKASCEDYESYAGSNGLREIGEIMEEDDVDEVEAEEIFNEERETLLDYWVEKYN